MKSSNAPAKLTKPGMGKKPYVAPVLQKYGALSQFTQGSGGTVGDAGGSQMIMSDQSVKQKIVRVGDHPLGIGLYLFEYMPEFRDQWGHGRQFGVIAQEVETVMPEAISVHENGYKAVNYGMLGIAPAGH